MLRVHELDKEMSGEDRFHLENISFHLPKGYICGLVGENGAGKTTLLRCLMGLYRSTGDIVIDGHNLNSDEAAAREVIAVVGDEGFFDENINLEKLGKYYGQMYVRFDMEKYLGYLERFNLDRKQKYKKLPLRYNNDKQKKPLFSRGLSVCRLLFNSFSKLKIDENYKEKRRLFY